MALMRLDKFLAEAGGLTRSEAKKECRKKRVSVNGEFVSSPESKIDPLKDDVKLDGRCLTYEKNHYYMLHKPAGTVSATEDQLHKTVLDVLHQALPETEHLSLFPVGRLDLDTEGLLLITDDGPLSHELLSPKKHVDKTYFVRVDGPLGEEDEKAFREGMDIGEKKILKSAKLEILSSGEESEAYVTIAEGKFHQIKRMFEKRGRKVLYLKRISMGSLTLDKGLALGQARALTEEELIKLKK
jgi:16S rRNA pseudouridine516 synthase